MYNQHIYDIYYQLKNSKKDFDFKDLAKIFEYMVCDILSNELNDSFLHYEDVDPNYKEDNNLSRNDSGVDFLNMNNAIGQCKLRSASLTFQDCATFLASQNFFDPLQKKTIIKWPRLILARNAESKPTDNLKLRLPVCEQYLYPRNEIIKYCEDIYENPPQNEQLILSNKYELRDYQKEAMEIIHQNQNCIINLPTGTGKNMLILESV